MAKMRKSATKTEDRGITFLKYQISEIANLREDLNYNDKTESYDGPIKVYCDNPDLKTNKVGEVQTQIKTTSKNIKSIRKHMFFKIDKADIDNYFKMNGVLYFHILILENGEKVVYYKVLLPFDLKKIINNNYTEINRLKFKILPNNEFWRLENICLNFLRNQELQISFKNCDFDFNNSIICDENNLLYTPTIVSDCSYNSLIGEEFYLYKIANINGAKIYLPYEKATLNSIYSSKIIKQDIIIDNIIYYREITIISKQENTIIKIGKSIILNDTTHELKFEINGSLEERINDLKFILSLNDLKDKNTAFIFLEQKMNKNEIEKYKSLLHFYLDIQKTLEILDINKEIDMSNMSDTDKKNINYLIDYFIYKKKIKSSAPTSMFWDVHISNLHFIYLLLKTNKNEFNIIEFNSKNQFHFLLKYKNNLKYNFKNGFLILKAEQLLADNIKIEDYKKAFDLMELNNDTILLANKSLLEIIKAYDNSKNEELLIVAKYCFLKLIDIDNNNITYKINLWQIQYRLNNLTKKDISEMKSILLNQNDLLIRFAINIILKNNQEAISVYENLTKEVKEYIADQPLYNLFLKIQAKLT
ncbi:MAG: hypothetical protein NC483_01115 [Ruminococcus sp.]|nr:hypothetical protein [Ruminococcus sp.]